MNHIYDFFNYGSAFIVGNAVLLLALLGTIYEEKTKLKNITRIMFLIAFSLIAFSYQPISNVLFRFQIVMTLFLMVGLHFGSRSLAPARTLIRLFIIVASYFSISEYLDAREMPILTTNQFKSIYVLGSTLGKSENSWPLILKRDIKSNVIDLTASDATIYSAVEQAELIPNGGDLIVILLGVKELNDGADPKRFEEDIHTLFWSLSKTNNTVVMFELPTTVFQKQYIKIQREYANRYGVKLIPRNELFSALDKESINDEHMQLNQDGQKRIARAIIKMIKQPTAVQRKSQPRQYAPGN